MINEVEGFAAREPDDEMNKKGEVVAKDVGAIADALVTISSLVDKIGSLNEFEIGPLVVYPTGAIAVDARATLKR